jgi:hypothetical protein
MLCRQVHSHQASELTGSTTSRSARRSNDAVTTGTIAAWRGITLTAIWLIGNSSSLTTFASMEHGSEVWPTVVDVNDAAEGECHTGCYVSTNSPAPFPLWLRLNTCALALLAAVLLLLGRSRSCSGSSSGSGCCNARGRRHRRACRCHWVLQHRRVLRLGALCCVKAAPGTRTACVHTPPERCATIHQ